MDWLKQAVKDVFGGLVVTPVVGLGDTLTALGRTIKELADSKKAVLGALAVITPALSSIFPEHKAALEAVTPFAEAAYLLLITAYGVIDALNASNAAKGG